MKTLLLDDEPKALLRLQKLCMQNSDLDVVEAFTKPLEALDYIRVNPVDLVLLDIEMPNLSGLAVAEEILDMRPEVDVVFITAYDKYALEAFQVNAVGYLLKPISQEELNHQIDKLMRKRVLFQQAVSQQSSRGHSSQSDKQEQVETLSIGKTDSEDHGNLHIYCMGGFACYSRDGVLIKWRTSKAEELIALLIHQQGQPISKERIIDVLWPEMDYDRASKNLHAICYYIRDTFQSYGLEGVLVRSKGMYTIQTKMMWIDLHLLKPLLEITPLKRLSTEQLIHITQLDKGHYFENKGYDWAQPMGQWIANRLEEIALYAAEHAIQVGDIETAMVYLNNVIRNNAVNEEAYWLMIKIFKDKGDLSSATKWYLRCETSLKQELEVSPSEKIKKLMDFRE